LGLKASGASNIREVVIQGNYFLDKEKPNKESRSKMQTRIKGFPHRFLKDREVVRTKWPFKPAPAKKKNEINHAIKIRLTNTINNIFHAFEPTYERVLGLFNNNMVTIDEWPETT